MISVATNSSTMIRSIVKFGVLLVVGLVFFNYFLGTPDEKAKAKNTTVSKANQALMMELSSIEENLYQVRNQSSQDPLNFPIKLNNKLASLMRVVESGDYKPTAGSYKVFEELKVELALEINHLDKVLSQKTIKKYL